MVSRSRDQRRDWLSLSSGGSSLIRALFTCWSGLWPLEVKDSIPLRHLTSCTGISTVPGIISSLKHPASHQLCLELRLNKLETIQGWPPPIRAYHQDQVQGPGAALRALFYLTLITNTGLEFFVIILTIEMRKRKFPDFVQII